MGHISAVTVYYIVGSVATVIGIIYGGIRFYNRQREHWMQEGEQRTEQANATKLNTHKLTENTTAITSLTNELREFILNVRIELNGHEGRIARLERWREDHGIGARRRGEGGGS